METSLALRFERHIIRKNINLQVFNLVDEELCPFDNCITL